MLGVLVAAPAHAIGGTVPDAPTFVDSEQVAAGVVGISWDAPPSAGSSPISSYTATSTPDGLTCSTTDMTPGHEYCEVPGLAQGTAYTFTVVATNASGPSDPSSASASLTIVAFVLPPAPVIHDISASGSGSLQITGDLLPSGGLLPFVMTFTASPGGASCSYLQRYNWYSQCVISGLSNGSTYTVSATVKNAAGTGPASPSVAGVVIWVPGSPTNVSSTAATGGATVSWTAPADDGGSPILDYTVYATNYGIYPPPYVTCTTTTTSCTVPLPTVGTYSFAVYVRNAKGSGQTFGALAPITLGLPDAPTNVSASVDASRVVTVSWSAPAQTGGPPITGYSVAGSRTAYTCTIITTTSCAISGLPFGMYVFSVKANNAYGSGLSSTSSAPVAVPPGPVTVPPGTQPPRSDHLPPAPVSALTIVGQLASDGTVGARLSWAGPDDMVSARVGVGSGTASATQSVPGVSVALMRTSATVSGLRPGVTYTFAVASVDAAGNVGVSRTARVAGTTVRTTVAGTSTAGQVVPVRLSLRDLGGRGLATKPVQILVRPAAGGVWRVYRSLSTNSVGDVLVRPRLTASTQFAMRYAGEANRAGLDAAGAATVRVGASVSASLKIGNVIGLHIARRGTRTTLTGLVGPNKRGQRVYLQRLVGTVWKNVAVSTLGATSNFGFVLPTTANGTASYRVLRPADAANLAGASVVRSLTVA